MIVNLKIIILIILLILILLIQNGKKELFENNNTKFNVIVAFYNLNYEELKRCLRSIEKQNYDNYEVCIVDDASNKNINDLKRIEKEYNNKLKFKYIKKASNGGPNSSRIRGMKELNSKNEDVIVLIDGDDELYDENVFSYLNNVYKNNDINITFGNFVTKRGNKINNNLRVNCFKNKLNKIIKNNSFRDEKHFNPSHLKTFKYKLFKKIKKEDLFRNGEYIRTATDLALMFPMLEMSRNKLKCINKPLYIYTEDHPNSLHNNKEKRRKQKEMDLYLRSRPKYDNIF